MPQGEMDWVVRLKFIDNINEVVNHLKQAASSLGTGGAGGAQFAQVATAARERIGAIASRDQIPTASLARHLGELDKVIQKAVQAGNAGYSRAVRAGGIDLSNQPAKIAGGDGAVDLGYLGKVAKAVGQRRKGAVFGADVSGGLADDDVYKQATARAAVSRQRIAADVETILSGDAVYKTATKQLTVARQRIAADVQTMLAGDEAYKGSTKKLTSARQSISADVQTMLADDEAYKGATKRLAVARQRMAADVQAALTGDVQYRDATKRSAIARERQQANLQEDLNGDSTYRSATRRLAVARQVQQKNLQEGLAGDQTYREATKRLAVVREVQNARLQEGLVGDIGYQDATKRVAVARQRMDADLQQGLAGDVNYQRATLNAAVARQAQQANLQEGLAGDQAYGQASRRAAVAKQQQQATLQAGLANDTGYADATRRSTIARLQQQATLQSSLAADPLYREATVRAAVARQRQQADLQQSLAGDSAYRTATVDATRARATIKAKVAESLAGDEGYKSATVRATIAREQQKADINSRLAADPAYAQATVQATAARERQTAAVKAGLASDQTYIAATARIANTREEQAARVSLARSGESTGLLPLRSGSGELSENQRTQLLARAATAERTRGDLQAAANARFALAEGGRGVAATVEKRIAESQLAVVLRQRERAEMRAAIKAGDVPGTRFQKLQALASPSAKAPSDFATIGQTAIQKTITTGGYALGGMVAGAALFGTIQAVKEASQLQEQFAGLRGQMESIGQSGSFAMVRDRIKGISNETGIASSEVTKFAARLLGVFNDPNRALKETEAAMKLAVVSGTDLATMIEELVPIAAQFDTSIENIGDLAVSIHDKFGIAEEATLHFLGEVAPLAQEAGLSLEDMGVIGATAANAMGKSMNVAAEQFSKVLPTMQGNQDKIFQILRSNPQTASAVDPIVEAFGRGESGAAFKLILESYNKLDRVQQDNLVRVSGSRREWALLNGLFNNSAKVLNDMADAESNVGRNKGALDRRFNDVSGTLNRSFERIKEQFKNVIEGLLSSGIGDALAAIGKGIETAVGLVNLLTGAFLSLNEATKIPGLDNGLLVPLVQFAAAAFLANKAMTLFSGLAKGTALGNITLSRSEEGLSASITRRTAATAAGEPGLVTDTNLKSADAAATGEAAAAEATLAGRRYGASGSGLLLPAGGAAAAASGFAGQGVGGWLGTRVGNSPLLTRAFAGGRFFQGTQLMQGANESALAAGTATGVGTLAGIAIPVIGAMQVKSARDEQSEKLEVASNDLRERVKTATDSELRNISSQYNDFWDDVQEGMFHVDLPGQIAQGELNRRKGARGGEIIGALQNKGLASKFVDSMTDDAIGDINSYLSKNVRSMDYAQELGVSTDKGLIGGVIDKLTGTKGTSILAKMGPLGWSAEVFKALGIGKGQTTLTRSELKKLLPEIKRRQEAREGGANEIASMIEGALANDQTDSELRRTITDALGEGNAAKAVELAGGMEAFLEKQGLYDPKGLYQTGQIGRGRYIGLVRQRVADLRKQIAGAPDVEKAQKEFDAALKEAQDLQDTINLERVETLKQTAPLTEFRPKTKIYQALLETLPHLQVPKQIEKIPDLIQGNWDQFQEDLSLIQDPLTFAQRASRGVFIDADTQILQMTKDAKDREFVGGLLGNLAGYRAPVAAVKPVDPTLTGDAQRKDYERYEKETKERERQLKDNPAETADELSKAIAERATKDGISFKDAALRIAKEREALQKAADPEQISPYTQFIKDVEASPDFADVDALVKFLAPPPEIIRKNLIDQLSQAKKSTIALRASQSGTSPYVGAAAQLATAREELDRLLQQKANGTGGVNIDAEISQAQAGVNTALQQSQAVVDSTAAAMDNWAVVMANGDPVKETTGRLDAANNALTRLLAENHGDERDPRVIQLRQQIQQLRFTEIDNANAIFKAQMDLRHFDRNENPQKAAQDALEAASVALAVAKGEAAGEAAKLQAKQAVRQMRQEEEAFLEASAQSDITMATIRQDPVGAAERAVREAERRLADAKARDLGRTVLKQLTDELAQKRSDAIDTAVSQQTDLIDYMLTMGQITTGQAIERLKVERDKYEVNSKKWRDIQLRINSLQQGAKQDAAFNLPANIALPTLYEARRLNQTRQMGVGYMDNRNVAVTFYINGAQDPAAVSNQMLGALSGALGGGQTYSPGLPVGLN